MARSEAFRLSQYRSAGRKTSRTVSGGRSTARSRGTNPTSTPAASISTGGAIPVRLPTMPPAEHTGADHDDHREG